MAATTTQIQPDQAPLRLQAACMAHLGTTPDETIAVEKALSDPMAEAPAQLRADLRRRLDEIERDEANVSARREYDGAEEVWSFALSDATRACRALLDRLDDRAAASETRPPERATA